MSFILDALRRAEADPAPAPRATAPIVVHGVADGPPDPWRIGKLAAGGLALIALGAAVAWWLTADRAPPPASVAAPSAETPPPAAAPAAAPAGQAPLRAAAEAPRRDVRALDAEAARARPAAPRPAPAPTNSAGTTLPPPGTRGSVTILPDPTAAEAAPAEAANAAPQADPAADLPGYENLLTAGRIDLPNLTMDMHVYNRVPAKRFVFLNLRKYREGDRLDARTVVETITPRGAVLNHDGRRFFLRPN